MDSLFDFFRTFWVVWLMLIFVGIVFWAYRPRNREKMKDHGQIPLRDGRDKPEI